MEEKNLNYESLIERNEMYQRSIKKGLKALIKCLPREKVIELLKELKYIERDWLSKKETYREKK